jgi:Single-strand binding protein family
MATLNKVTLIGNLGADPELKPTGNDKSFAILSLATHEIRKIPSYSSRIFKGHDSLSGTQKCYMRYFLS